MFREHGVVRAVIVALALLPACGSTRNAPAKPAAAPPAPPAATKAAATAAAAKSAAPATSQGAAGTMELAVDATDAPRGLLHSRATIPVRAGPLTLLYPEWIPGEHGPTGPVSDVANLKVSGGGKALAWRRDLQDMYAWHVEVPAGVTSLEVSFDFILPPSAEGFSSGASSTAQLLVLSWNQVVIHPDAPRPDELMVSASLKLPKGWKYATALTTEGQPIRAEVPVAGDAPARFATVSLTTLVDSPVAAGRNVRRVDLTPKAGPPCFLDLVSDSEAALAITNEQAASYRRLVDEALALFGAHHFEHYDFLYTLSDGVAHFGLEHHQSSDDRMAERTFVDEDDWRRAAGLLPHEMVHSWNGKYRRPAGLATGDFTTPMQGDLLWVYEGLTEYLGNVLTARSGLFSPEEYRDNLALIAARLDQQPGRTWRPLQDTADNAQVLYEARSDWESLRRGTDFYDEGELLWLEVDVTIREQTHGAKSLDDFCKAFHGGESGKPSVKPYTFEDLVAALNAVAPYDWKTLLTTRLQSLDPRAPLGGIEHGGWKLVFTDEPGPLKESYDTARKRIDLRYSIGALLDEEGALIDVIAGMPAAQSGLAPGMTLLAVNGRKWSREVLGDAVRATKNGGALELLVANGEFFETHAVKYAGGERFPHLQRDEGKPDLLSAVIGPVVKTP